MRNGDFYTHFKKGTEYFFDCIALPVGDVINQRNLTKNGVALDAHTPDDVPEPQELQLFTSLEGVTFISAPDPHVIYQSEEDYNTDKVWARRVDDFFGYKVTTEPVTHTQHFQKRFTLKERTR
jgi:hypothetical protein